MSFNGKEGVVAAGHPLTAEAGARMLRAGGNAVDAAVAAILTACVVEPLLTGLGAGGYMLVAGAQREPVLLDFFVESPGRESPAGSRAEMTDIEVSFGDATAHYHVGPASCGAYGTPAGVCAAVERWGSMPLAELCAPAAALARDGVALSAEQAYIAEILRDLLTSTPECASLYAPSGEVVREGEILRNPELADALELLGAQGAAPFYTGAVADAVASWLAERGGVLTRADLAAYRAIERRPIEVPYRGRAVLTNPPPAAGGALLAYALVRLGRAPEAPGAEAIVEAMEAAQAERTPEFLQGLAEDAFLERFLALRAGSTTHISVVDRAGMACSTTTTTGEGSGVIVPGTGLHLNNIMGEQDLNPFGFHRHAPGTRMPSMMAPTVVLRDGEVELVLGSAGSTRIRSAMLQTIVGVIDRGLGVEEAVSAPRLHYEDSAVYVEPGLDVAELARHDRRVVQFRRPSLFFGGVQAVLRDLGDGALSGAGDPRRGGVAVHA